MQLLKVPATGGYGNQNRGHSHWNGSRRPHNLAEQYECIRRIAGGDRAHIPDDWHAGIKVGRQDVEVSSVTVLVRNLSQHGSGHVSGEHSFKRLAAGEAIAQ